MLEHEKKYGRFTCYASTPLENRCWVDGINFMLIYFFESDLSRDFLSKGTNSESEITHISNNIPPSDCTSFMLLLLHLVFI